MHKPNIKNIGGIEWAECPSFPGYWITSSGRVMAPSGKILRTRVNNLGYVKAAGICFVNDRRRYKKSQSVHRLVMDAWTGPCPSGQEVDHIDHDKQNNRLDNLRYITHRENIIHAHEAGRFPEQRPWMIGRVLSQETKDKMSQAKLGAKHWRSVKPNAEEIISRHSAGETTQAIADSMGLKRTVVGDILRGTHWSVRK